jgi:hypothetical protein
MAHDRGVDEDVERFGCNCTEGGQRKFDDLAVV